MTFEEYYPVFRIWLEVRAYPSDEGLCVCLRDVTERRRNEEQFRLLQSCVSRLNDVLLITGAEPLMSPGRRFSMSMKLSSA